MWICSDFGSSDNKALGLLKLIGEVGKSKVDGRYRNGIRSCIYGTRFNKSIVEYEMKLSENYVPKMVPCRKIPFNLYDTYKKKLDRMEETQNLLIR